MENIEIQCTKEIKDEILQLSSYQNKTVSEFITQTILENIKVHDTKSLKHKLSILYPNYADKYTIIGKFKNRQDKIKVLTDYGEHMVSPSSLLAGSIPSINSAIDKNLYFMNKSHKIHNYKYTYSKIDYQGAHSRIKITCSVHGDFEQSANHHLQGKGCRKCRDETNSFKLTDWSKMCPGNPGIFYILRCWNEDEEFYKVGITCQDEVSKRYGGINQMPYDFEIVKEIKDNSREKIWNLEKKYLSLLSEYRYIPKIEFSGYYNECFKQII